MRVDGSGGIYRSGLWTRSWLEAGGATVEKLLWKDIGNKGEEEGEKGQEEANEAKLKEEGEELVLDDFFRRADASDKAVLIEGGTGATETDAEEDTGRGERDGGITGVTVGTFKADIDARLRVTRSRKPGIEGSAVEAEADIGGFGDVALENTAFWGVWSRF